MPVSIIEVDVNDAKFKDYQARFDEYRARVKEIPDAWRQVEQAYQQLTKPSGELVKDVTALQKTLQAVTNVSGTLARVADGVEKKFERLSTHAKEMWHHVENTTKSLLKWASVLSLGLTGGSLFGLDRIGLAAAGQRRSSLGLNTTAGNQNAFDVNFNRFFDTDSVLGNIAAAQNDPSKYYAFESLGIRNYRTRDTADVGAESALKAKQIFEQGGQNQQYAQARGLLEIYTMDDLRRLHNMTAEEIKQGQANYVLDKKKYDLSDNTLRQWQTLTTQLDRSGRTITTVLIEKLAPLAGPLAHLSDAFTTAIDKFTDTKRLTDWLNTFAQWVQRAGDYLASDKFLDDLTAFGDKLGDLVTAVEKAVNWFESFFGVGKTTAPGVSDNRRDRDAYPQTDPNGASARLKRFHDSLFGPHDPRPLGTQVYEGIFGTPAGANGSNVGNLKDPADPTGKTYQRFANPAEGILGILHQLQRYQDDPDNKWGHKQTIADMISTYVPKSDGNDTEGYIKYVAGRVGVKPDDKIDTHDPETMSKMIAAMIHMENNRNNYRPSDVKIVIQNNTSANVTVGAGAAAASK